MRRPVHLHVVTKLSIMVCMAAAAFLSEGQWNSLILTAVMAAVLTVQGMGRSVPRYIAVYASAYAVLLIQREFCVNQYIVQEFIFFMMMRLVPVVMAAQAIMRTQPGEITSVLQKAGISHKVSLMVVVAFRFMPTLMSEVREIRNNMGNRGMTSPSHMLRHPVRTVEYSLVPLLLRSLDIADELTVSAITRGAESPARRYSYFETPVRAADIVSVMAFAAVTAFLLTGGAA